MSLLKVDGIDTNLASFINFVKQLVTPQVTTNIVLTDQIDKRLTANPTFLTSPIVPTPTLAGGATNKSYVDGKGSGVIGSFSNLKASATGLSATVLVTADEISLESSLNQYVTLRPISLSIAGTSVGANGLDAGSLAISTWYSLWVIYDGTNTAGLMSLSATAPTLPSGYTYKARVGWIRTDGTANKYPLSFIQYGKKVQYKVSTSSNLAALPIPVSGAQGSLTTPTWVAVAVSNYVPTTATSIDLVLNSLGVGNSMAAPNNSYGAYNSASNPPPCVTLSAASGVDGKTISFMLESTNFYYAASGGYCGISGWEDNL